MKKLFLWIVVVGLVVLLAALAYAFVPTKTRVLPDGAAPDSALIERGRYLAAAGDCTACHTRPGGKPFAGGLPVASPLGNIYSTNITPDKDTGIGSYSLDDFDRAVRHGIAPDGRTLYPAMPYPSYARITDEDVRALHAYFLHGDIAPVKEANKPVEITWPLSMRWPLAIWRKTFAPDADAVAFDASRYSDPQLARGAYLVQGLGHCGSCHTARGAAFNEKAFDESSPVYVAGALLDGWYAPSLRNDPNTGLGRWSEADVYQFLKTGRNQHAVVFGSMTDVINNSTQFMTDEDLKAIAHYLKSLPGSPERDGPPWKYDTSSNAALALDQRVKIPGAQTFAARCSACHGAQGRGQAPWIPPLAGAASSMSKENASSINVTLNGSGRIVANGMPDAYRMPPFRNQLSDKEIADVLTFVRGAWGNQGGAVTQDAVKDLRKRTDPASSEVIILQMR